MLNKVHFGDCRESMRALITNGVKVNMCVTSPPYWGLRDYGTADWHGGDMNCDHIKRHTKHAGQRADRDQSSQVFTYKNTCGICGAVSIDKQLGAESSPQEFVSNLVDVFALVWELLEDDGTLWLNLGDSYYNYRPGAGHSQVKQTLAGHDGAVVAESSKRGLKIDGLKEKDLCMIPARVALALQDWGWYLRSDIIWHKPNPMPESVKDRPTSAHEHIFLLSKKKDYYYDADAIKEESTYDPHNRFGNKNAAARGVEKLSGNMALDAPSHADREGRNKRNVWTVATKPYSGAHFAVFPPALIEPCILAGSKVGGIVFDPFMGSGTTGQVAQDLGRNWLGCELNKDYEPLQQARTAQQGLNL